MVSGAMTWFGDILRRQGQCSLMVLSDHHDHHHPRREFISCREGCHSRSSESPSLNTTVYSWNILCTLPQRSCTGDTWESSTILSLYVGTCSAILSTFLPKKCTVREAVCHCVPTLVPLYNENSHSPYEESGERCGSSATMEAMEHLFNQKSITAYFVKDGA